MAQSLKIAIINKSDSTGGAAVVSFRLMQALRAAGVDARMVVAEKLTDSPYVELAASPRKTKRTFLMERLKIFIANGFRRSTLFKIDTASDGLPLWKHPVVKEADIVMLNWVNQGLLSLKGIRKIARLGKKIIWTMHDMWCFTGVCHHSGECVRFERKCVKCPLMKGGFYPRLARAVQKRKKRLYSHVPIEFVAVSNWLADRGLRSSLFDGRRPTVIPNAFPFDNEKNNEENRLVSGGENREIRILFGAARIDDPVKGLPILIETTKLLKRRYPYEASRMRLITFGEAKDPNWTRGIAIAHTHLGRVSGKEELQKVYREGDIVLSTSLYETLPGTLVEGQAFGCIPVAFSRGGQSDIIDHQSTGFLALWEDSLEDAAGNIAEGVAWASRIASMPEELQSIRKRMYHSAFSKFNEQTVADKYLELIERISG